MSDSDLIHLLPPVAAALGAAGWPALHPALKEAAAVAARGHNLVYVAPPAPAWAAPVLGGVLSRPREGLTGPVLALCPAEAIDEWARIAERTALGTGLRIAGTHSPGRITRLIRSGTVDLAFLTAETAHELVRRSALKMDAIGGLLLLWPEAWDGDELVTALLQDASRETQRIVVTADLAGMTPLIERYCWRAPVVDLLGEAPGDPPAVVRSASVGWRRRQEALADLVEQFDPETLAVWTADQGDAEAISRTLGAVGLSAPVGTAIPAPSALIVAYDLPTPAILKALTQAGEVLLLVPAGAEAYAARLAPRRRPVQLRGLLDRAQAGLAAHRRTIGAALEKGVGPLAYIAVAPLLERHEASAVAAALYELWEGARSPAPEAAAPVRSAGPSVKLWVGIGRGDGATTSDLMAALIKDAGVPKENVGKIELRETFALVELGGGADPAQVAERLTGKTIRKRRLVARLDRGRTKP